MPVNSPPFVARGIIKPKPGEKPFAEWWAEHKREEHALEERKYRRPHQPG